MSEFYVLSVKQYVMNYIRHHFYWKPSYVESERSFIGLIVRFGLIWDQRVDEFTIIYEWRRSEYHYLPIHLRINSRI